MSAISKWNLLAAGFALLTAAGAQGMTATLTSSMPSPMPVGTRVTFTAAASGASGANLWYRFRVRAAGKAYHTIRDYGPVSTLAWTAADSEGMYDVQVSVRNLGTGDESTVASPFEFQSLVTAGQAVVTPTGNSLVFLFSAPACDVGSRMRVRFHLAGGTMQHTHFKACTAGSSMNFYLAGLLANTTYSAQSVIETGSTSVPGTAVTFTTGDIPASIAGETYTDTILVPSATTSDPILLGGPLSTAPIANDLAGNVLWYGPDGVTFLTRVEAGGEFWGIVETQGGADSSQQVVRKFDLTGMTLLETNAARVSEQLKAMGKRSITAFHHEARSIADGRIAVLAGVEQILTDVQGAGPVDVLGDMIVILDKELNVVWAWDTFDNLDTHRAAPLGETCPAAGCPPFYLAASANDWTHGNALQETADGNILYSTRNQDWLIKISYDGGNGDGHIIWRLGIDGDFKISSGDPFPWFSHQHDGNFETKDATMLLVFDDGNTRVAAMGGNSRGQVYQLDEPNLMATPVLNTDLGVYAEAVGSAQALPDGNYHFDAGFVQENNTVDSYSFEINPAGQTQYEAHQNVILYRTFRMPDMYTPPK